VAGYSVRLLVRWLGSLLIVCSALGVFIFGAASLAPDDLQPPWRDPVSPPRPANDTRFPSAAPIAAATITTAATPQPITGIAIDRIGLQADVVESPLIERDGALTWEVPAFKVGHAEGTAGAREPGNAVLLGHVTSVRSGNVFATLDQVVVGDLVGVRSGSQSFPYAVVSVDRVDRTDSTVLDQQTSTPTVSLVTCTGVWLPTIWDYTERLVVRAQLSTSASSNN